ncbi:Nif3-like dinuclear metal center hexameric protein [Fulvivirgaceae bacterium BMA10]|uniref:GTP cyclohydrolase 1 type 2 homolog n=1 Tax=Splendidivirga corallicola TaxID=3051826 RepID=A0ABT8KJF5_9BACT|nr:Nif3-like dinuclear metal center hexameric protein [Fulvivirgaceae bacterium BMA10]
MIKIKDVIQYLENIAPLSYQESYDNAGLITGDLQQTVSGVMICLDSTEDVLQEAVRKGCNLVIAHHPIIFRGLKKVNGSNYVERTIIFAIKNDIAIYAIHTNLDNVHTGVNRKIAEKIGLENVKILNSKKDTLSKLVSFVPKTNTDDVLEALSKAGAGNIGNYEKCSFRVTGTGAFKPNESANPSIGERNQLEEVQEDRIEVIFPTFLETRILNALKQAHPYEEVAHYIQTLSNKNQEIGSGMIGNLPESMQETGFLSYLKEKMMLNCIRHTALLNKPVQKVAICGGSGSFLLKTAMAKNADVFITADFKYHEFFDADNQILILDIGHYESEVFTKDLIYELLNKKFTNIALYLTECVTNPISYF